MIRNLSHFLVAGLLLLIAQGVWAEGKVWYAAVGGGAAFADDVDATLPGVLPGVTLTADLDTGYLVTGALGITISSRQTDRIVFRGEGEVSYFQNDISSLSVPGASVPVTGDGSILAYMANGYYDFKTNPRSRMSAYIGGGVGGAKVSVNDLTFMGAPLLDDSDTVFAYQVKAGVAYEFTEILVGTVGYRYFATNDADVTAVGGVPTEIDGASIHSVEAGLRVRF